MRAVSFRVEIKAGPRGSEGGVPFPEVGAEMERMSRGGPLARPWLLKLLPTSLVVKKMREMMGFPNLDTAGDRVTTEHRTIAGPNGDIPIRIYTPQGDGLAVHVYFHGGGWIGGSVDVVENIGRGIADRAGAIVVNVDYRLAPEHRFPAGLEDCYAAIEWTHRHARELGGDAERLSVGGDSAGANLATVCCLLAPERGGPDIHRQVLIYPGVDLSGRHDEEHGPQQEPAATFDLSGWIGSLYVERREQLADPRCSPWLADDVSALPAAFVLTAEYCFLRDQGESYARKLAASGVPVRAVRYNGLNHAFLDKVGVWSYADDCIEDIARFLTDPPSSGSRTRTGPSGETR